MPPSTQEWVKKQRPTTFKEVCTLGDMHKESQQDRVDSQKRPNPYKTPGRREYPSTGAPTDAPKEEKPRYIPGKGPLCYWCDEYGHIKAECPKRNPKCLVTTGGGEQQMDTYSRIVEGKHAKNILIDPACTLSQVHPDFVSTDFAPIRKITLMGATGTSELPTTRVTIELEGKTF